MDWLDRFLSEKIFHRTSSVSDHCPMVLQLEKSKKVKRYGKTFRFEAIWLKDSSCEEIVNSACEEASTTGSNFPMVKCLDNCCIKLEMWNKSVFGQVGNNLTRLPKHLEWLELQCVMPEVIASMRETRVELNSWRDKAEAMWN